MFLDQGYYFSSTQLTQNLLRGTRNSRPSLFRHRATSSRIIKGGRVSLVDLSAVKKPACEPLRRIWTGDPKDLLRRLRRWLTRKSLKCWKTRNE